MVGCYDIMLGNQKIGTVEVYVQGLYYYFHCRCKLTGDVMYQLKVFSGEKVCNLGVLIPIGNEFGMDTKVAISKVGKEALSFIAVPRHLDMEGKFIPIRADEPFLHIEKLEKAYLKIIDGTVGACVEDMI